MNLDATPIALDPGSLRRRRLRWGMTIAQFAALLGTAGPTLSNWETGVIPFPRLLPWALESIENRLCSLGNALYDDPAEYRLIKVGGTDYYKWPPERPIPKGVKEVRSAYDENGLLFIDYWPLPVLFAVNYTSRHRWTSPTDGSNSSKSSG